MYDRRSQYCYHIDLVNKASTALASDNECKTMGFTGVTSSIAPAEMDALVKATLKNTGGVSFTICEQS